MARRTRLQHHTPQNYDKPIQLARTTRLTLRPSWAYRPRLDSRTRYLPPTTRPLARALHSTKRTPSSEPCAPRVARVSSAPQHTAYSRQRPCSSSVTPRSSAAECLHRTSRTSPYTAPKTRAQPRHAHHTHTHRSCWPCCRRFSRLRRSGSLPASRTRGSTRPKFTRHMPVGG